jgi:protein TonB
LTQAPHRQPPAVASREQPAPSPFVNPADTYNRARVTDNYLWQVVRKLASYRYQAQVSAREGTTVVRIVIARDGRLIDVAVARSSGFPVLDRGVVAGVRAGSPYAPLPPEIHGDRATFTLPLVSIRSQ